MNLFVYGTLLVPRIWEAVTGSGSTRSAPALLPGFSIHRVRNADYPGIVRMASAEGFVSGRIYYDLSDPVTRRLDAYEDSFYRREEVLPFVEGISTTPAQAYVVPEETASTFLSDEPWSLEWFEENGLERFWSRHFG